MALEYRRPGRAAQSGFARDHTDQAAVSGVQLGIMRPLILLAIVVALAGDGIGAQAPGPRAYLVAIDDLHLDFRATPRVRKVLQDLAASGREEDTYALVTTGTSSIRLEPTPGVAALRAAVSRITGNGLRERAHLEASADANAATEIRHRASVSDVTIAEAITRLARSFSGPPTILYFTDGYDARLVPAMPEVVRTTKDARGRMIVVSARDLVPREPPSDVRPAEWRAYLEATQASLRTLAEQTGGIAVFSQTELDATLPR